MSTARKWRASQKKKPWLRGQMEGAPREVYDGFTVIGRWTQDKHKIFMQEYEKYGNNCMQIAQVLSTRTPAQIKKHAECFFKQILQQWNDIKSLSLPIRKHKGRS